MPPLRVLAAAAALAVVLFHPVAGSAADAAHPSAGTGLVPASDPSFRWAGRFDATDPASPVVIWEASTVSVDFEGDHLGLRFGAVTGQVFMDATVDGARSVVALRDGTAPRTVSVPVSGGGRHHLVLFKRSEASAGTARFLGLELASGAAVFPPEVPAYRMRMEVYGDSITAGACDEDGDKDQWEDRRTHNAAFSWAAVTAGALSADYRNISVSGIGLAAGYTDVLAGQVWDRTYPNAGSARADLARWIPDLVLVLLGDNDDSYTRDHALPFPANFAEKYTSLVRGIRSAYPDARIVLLNGGMWAGTHSEPLIRAWTAAVTAIESQDPNVSHFVFRHWTSNHPRVSDHRMLAMELEGWLRQQPFLTVLDAKK